VNVFYHFSSVLLSNTYLVGPEQGGDAILIDPGEMDAQLLRMIESNGYYVRSILLTLAQPRQVHGVRTLLKIYEAKLYGNEEVVYECRCRKLADADRVYMAGYEVEVFDLTDNPLGPLVYRIENFVFTGLLFTAGNIVAVPDRRNQMEVMEQIESRILSLPDEVLILPGAGPPSSVRSERFLRKKANN
jgi:glyoxylase-like metal-dependent hydrolase (beta-lactamase superfamily II)